MALLSDDDIRVVLSEGQRRPLASRAVIFGSIPDADVDGFLLELHLNAARELMKLEVVLGQIAEEDKLSDFMTAFLRSACRGMNITVHQQERGGRSGSDERKTNRGGVGERDWTVQADAVEVAVVEALQLPNSQKEVWHHLKKLLERYDRAGLPRAFMVLYVRDDDFDTVLTDYQKAVRAWAASEAQLVGDVEMHSKDAAYLQVLKSAHRRGENATTTVFHVLVRVARQ